MVSPQAIAEREFGFWSPEGDFDHAELLRIAQEKNATLTDMRRQLRRDRRDGEFVGDLPLLIKRLEEDVEVDWAVLEDRDTYRGYGHYLEAIAAGGRPDMHSSIGKFLVKNGYLTRHEVGRGSSKRIRYRITPRGAGVVRRYSQDSP